MDRRSVMRLGALVAGGALAGCVGQIPTDSPTVTVSRIVVRNRLDREVDVALLLLDDGEATYWRTVAVPAGEHPFATIEDLPEAAGQYVLYAQIPGTVSEPTVRADLAASNAPCVTVDLAVTTANVDGEAVPAVAYGNLGGCESSPRSDSDLSPRGDREP